MFLASFMIPWNVAVTIHPPVPLMVITPSFIMNVICAQETGASLPINPEKVSFPLESTTECP